MADDQSQAAHDSQVSSTEKVEANENHTNEIIVENGISSVGKLPEASEKMNSSSHGKETSEEHENTDSTSAAVASHAPTKGDDKAIETNETNNHVEDGRTTDCKPNQDDDSKEEKISEHNGNDTSAVENEECSSGLSDDQKVDKSDDHVKREEISDPSEGDVNKCETVDDVEKMGEDSIKKKTPTAEEFTDCSSKARQVADNAEEPFDEPNTEAYYTSSFTFVCQKSHEEGEEEIEQDVDDFEEKTESSEIIEANIAGEESSVISETPEPIKASSGDVTADSTSASGPDEIHKSSFNDTSLSEGLKSSSSSENTTVTEEILSSELSYECTLTGDFHEVNDEAENRQLANEKNENESEVDAEVYNIKINTNSTDEELTHRTESTVSDSDVELKVEKIERPTHFVRLKPTGVQKTERPYDSGTTESKIAMEIREMREREEELRQMRERMQSPEGNVSSSNSPLLSPVAPTTTTTSSKQKSLPPLLPQGNSVSPESGPGYRVSTVFGHKSGSAVQSSPVEEEKKIYRSFSKESAVEKEIRIARNREEELRKEKGLPPREDDSYIKPSQVKSAQVRVFGKMNVSNTSKELATTKIQQEIEEQTLREMALREKGHIQTISQERTDSKVAKLKDLDVSTVPECISSAPSNGHVSPLSDRSSKRSTPSPTGSSHGSFPPVSPRPVINNSQGKGISMQKFIASKGKETTFIASRSGPSHPEQNADVSRSNPVMRKAKRTVSVESKIQQEILEMKLREEELRRMHNSSTDQTLLATGQNGTDHDGEDTNGVPEYTNGQEVNGDDDSGPSSNNLIAQWEQRIQKAEERA